MNPAVPQSFIDAHLAEDPARAQAEYLAKCRSDLDALLAAAAAVAAVVGAEVAAGAALA